MWLALTLVGFITFLASVVAFIRLGFDAQGRWQPTATKILALVLVSLVTWLVGLKMVPPPYPLEQTKRWVLPE